MNLLEQVLVGLCKIKERLLRVFREGVAQSGQSRMFLPFRSKVQILSSSLNVLNNFANIVKWYNRCLVIIYFQFDSGYWLQFTKVLCIVCEYVQLITGVRCVRFAQGHQLNILTKPRFLVIRGFYQLCYGDKSL